MQNLKSHYCVIYLLSVDNVFRMQLREGEHNLCGVELRSKQFSQNFVSLTSLPESDASFVSERRVPRQDKTPVRGRVWSLIQRSRPGRL